MTNHVPQAVASGVAPLVAHVSGTQHLSLAISLPLRNQAELDDLFQRIYDPQSPSYHKYLSVQEFTERFGPTESDYAALLRFAVFNGLAVIDTAANRMVVDIDAPVATIENALHITLGVYQHPTESRTFYAPDREPTVDLDVPLLHISGLDNFTLPYAKNIKPSQVLRHASKTTGSGDNSSGSEQHVAEMVGK